MSDAAEVDRLERVLAQLEALPDVRARELAREAVRAVLDLHGEGLARALHVLAEEQGGTVRISQLARDPRVASLLMLHGLHPDGVEARVRRAVEEMGPTLELQHAQATLVGVEGGVATIELRAPGCGSRLREDLTAALLEAAPDLVRVNLVDGPRAGSAFVPMERLRSRAGGAP